MRRVNRENWGYPIGASQRPCTFFSALIALALVFSGACANAQNSETRALSRLIDSDCAQLLASSIGCERVMLLLNVDDPETADLLIFPDHRADDYTVPLLVARGIAFNGQAFGAAPYFRISEKDKLQLVSGNIGTGRSPWEQALNIAWNGQAFVIAGFQYSTHDRISSASFDCNLNLLSGEYSVEIYGEAEDREAGPKIIFSESGDSPALQILLADWHAFRGLPEICAGFMKLHVSD